MTDNTLREWEKEFNEIWSTSDLTNLKENLKNLVYRQISHQSEINFSSQRQQAKQEARQEIWEEIEKWAKENSWDESGKGDYFISREDLLTYFKSLSINK